MRCVEQTCVCQSWRVLVVCSSLQIVRFNDDNGWKACGCSPNCLVNQFIDLLLHGKKETNSLVLCDHTTHLMVATNVTMSGVSAQCTKHCWSNYAKTLYLCHKTLIVRQSIRSTMFTL